MNTKLFWKLMLACFCCIPFASCDSNSDDDIKEDIVKDIIMEISNTVVVTHPTTDNPTGEYMLVREKGREVGEIGSGTNSWIDGGNFQIISPDTALIYRIYKHI